MAILYPLTIPGSIGPIEANLKKMEGVGEFIGPFDGSAQQQQWPDQHWELDLVFPEMNWAQAAALDAFLGALHGKWGTFLWGPPLAAAPRGSGGTPTAVGTDLARSNLLTTTGWTASASGLLLPGDHLQMVTVPPGIEIIDVQVAGAYLYITLAAAPPAGTLAPAAVVNLAGMTVHPEFNGSALPLYGIAGAILQFATTHSTFSPVTETGSIAYAGGPTLLTRLHEYVGTTALASNSEGGAVLDIWPSLREAPPAGTAITLVNPSGLFRLAENKRESPAKRNKTIIYQMKCREAI